MLERTNQYATRALSPFMKKKSKNLSIQFLCLFEERIDYFAHVLYRLERHLVGLVCYGLLKDDEYACSLIQDACWYDGENSRTLKKQTNIPYS